MAGEKQPSIQIVWHQVAIVERFSSVLYPLDILELLKQIPTIGYVVPELVLRGTLEEGKPMATKGDIELLINNWFHILIEPLVASSSRRYRINWVWRGSDTEELLEKFSKVDETLQKLIAKLESG